MKIHNNFDQNSLEWLLARSGVVTASEFDNLLTPKFKSREGGMVKSYLTRKLSERWIGGPIAGFLSFDMDQGKILEDEAKPWLSLELNQDVENVALITADDGKIGCSPDGVIGGNIGVEIKCPQAPNHVRYVLDNAVPEDYLAQVHGSLYVTGWPAWKFVSYRRGFPNLVLTIERDEDIMEKIGEALTNFLEYYDREWQRLCDINGGPPVRTPVSAPPMRREVEDYLH